MLSVLSVLHCAVLCCQVELTSQQRYAWQQLEDFLTSVAEESIRHSSPVLATASSSSPSHRSELGNSDPGNAAAPLHTVEEIPLQQRQQQQP